MKIGVWYNSVEETLQNLGMPPNPTDDDRGFMVWETDGKENRRRSAAIRIPWPIAWCHQTRPQPSKPR